MRFSLKGVLVSETTYCSSRRDAERVLAKRKSELIDSLVLGKKKPIKLHQAIDEFQASRSHLPSYKNTKTHLALFRALPNHWLDKVTDKELSDVIEKRLSEGYAISTCAGTANYFNALLNYCKEKEYSIRRRMRPLKGVRGRIRWLTDEEERRFFDAINPDVEYNGKSDSSDRSRQDAWDLLMLLRHTGARYSEIANMTWGQIDFSKGTVLIKRKKDGIDSTLHLTRVMTEIFERRLSERVDDYVFPTKQGKHNMTHFIQKAVARAGLSKVDGSVSCHTLRHTAAVKWLQGGLSIIEVQHLLGHKSLNSTLVYLHVLPQTAADKARALMDGGLSAEGG